MIRTFADKRTGLLFEGRSVKRLPADVVERARSKLLAIHVAADISFLRAPPGNRLEALRGDRAGQHSIRVNDQWRICFVWRDGDACDVEFCDYH